MKISDIKRNNLRYLLFRIKAAAKNDSPSIKPDEVKSLLNRWGHDISKAAAKRFMHTIREHFEEQLYFTGWENFADERLTKKGIVGTAKAWDLGMSDGSDMWTNVARMVNRPNKWFLFGKSFLDVIPTRDISTGVIAGLDFFEKKDMASKISEENPRRREINVYPDPKGREFHYIEIYKKGL